MKRSLFIVKNHTEIFTPPSYVDSEGEIWFLNDEYKIVRSFLSRPKDVLWDLGGFKYLVGKPHRVGAPAIVFKSGEEQWWVDGKRHRNDGPQTTFNDENGWVKNYAENDKLLRVEFENGVVWNYE